MTNFQLTILNNKNEILFGFTGKAVRLVISPRDRSIHTIDKLFERY